MKTKKLFFGAILLLGIMVCSGCKKDNSDENSNNNPENPNGNSDNPEFYALDISQETDWDYVVVADNGNAASIWFNIDKATNIPTTMFYKPFNNQDYGFSVNFKSNGLPDYAVWGDTIIVFENFRDTKCDIAVIYPNISVKYFNNIETGIDWSSALRSSMLRSVSPEVSLGFEHGLKFIGSALAVVGAAAAICNPAGITVLGAITIGLAVVTIANNYWLQNMAVGLSSDVAGKVNTMIGCAGAFENPYSAIECFSGLAGFTASASADIFGFANSRQPLINTIQANMKNNNPADPNNPSNPTDPNNPDNPGNIVDKTLTINLTSTMGMGDESYTCVLKTNSVVQVDDVTGTWEQGGNSLRMNWTLNNEWHCTYSLTGTLNGNSYSGTYTHIDYGTTLYDKGTFTGTMQ